MAFQTIDLTLSDDEDESPQKAAKAALNSFAPRKSKDAAKVARGAERVDDEEEDARSPEEVARTVLDSFATRQNGLSRAEGGLYVSGSGHNSKHAGSLDRTTRPTPKAFAMHREAQSSGLMNDERLGVGRYTEHEKQQTRSVANAANGLLGSSSAERVPLDRNPARKQHPRAGQHVTKSRGPPRLMQSTPTTQARAAHIEKESLAAILQREQQLPVAQPRAPQQQSMSSNKPAQVDEQARRANAIFDRTYQRHAARSSDMRSTSVVDAPTTGPNGQPLRFRLPTGWTPGQQPSEPQPSQRAVYDPIDRRPAQRSAPQEPHERFVRSPRNPPPQQHRNGQVSQHGNAPLKVVDVMKPAQSLSHDAAECDSGIRPSKRPRLSSPSPAHGDASMPTSHDVREEDSRVTSAKPSEQPGLPRTPRISPAPDPRLALKSPQRRPSTTGDELRSLAASRSSFGSGKKKGVTPFHLRHKTRLKPAEASDLQRRPTFNADVSSIAKTDIRPKSAENNKATQDPQSPVKPTSEMRPLPYSDARQQIPSNAPSNFGNQYTPEEDALLAELKEVRKLRWDEMLPYFKGRTKGSLQVRYSTKVGKRHQQQPQKSVLSKRTVEVARDDDSDSAAQGRRQRKRNTGVPAGAGIISWADVRRRKMEESREASEPSFETPEARSLRQFSQERAHPQSVFRILRQRELGISSRRFCKPVKDELKEHVFDDVGPLKYHKGTSGDVTCVAWSPSGRHFAAGSIAISDERSMQYNRPGNLIFGRGDSLRELPEHHVSRPAITARDNVNGLHAMRESQDPRLFMTVANVQFSPSGSTLYSAGTDKKVRAYNVHGDTASCAYEIDHRSPLDLLSVSNLDVLATACHSSGDESIGIYSSGSHLLSLSPGRIDQQTARAIFPSALRWGIHRYHSNLLLAGFSIDSIDEERDIAGETCLWDMNAQQAIPLPVTRNVFDVAWNPRPTSTSTAFAIASTPGTQKVSRGTRTIVQCFAPNQERASRVLEWECPAFDINDVMYCQHDDNLIAAGATDGKVYVWDQRFAGRKPTPLHILEHGNSLNVLDHDRPREIADTGVRFLSWGATSSRLYTGSSDGVVKIWNPYMSTENAHIKDGATFGSAVMSGAFSPDYRELLIGEDQGQINLLSVGHGEKAVRSMRKFEYLPAPAPEMPEDRYETAHELLRSRQIVLQPMGDLPIRQAVQGPNYAGPYLRPTDEEVHQAQREYDDALQAQMYTQSQDAKPDNSESPSQASHEVDRRVDLAQEALAKLQARSIDAAELDPQAKANQSRFHQAQIRRFKLETSLSVECCKLDCNYLPAEVDDDGDVADSGRSSGRIPGTLRLATPQDTALLTSDEMVQAGLNSKCIACSAPAAKPKAGLPLCELCATTRKGLTAKCARCSALIRPQAQHALCEGCSFACFRCGGPTVLPLDRSSVRCNACNLTWTTGVLGYELQASLAAERRNNKRSTRRSLGQELEFGEDEMERQARRWGCKMSSST